MAYDLEGLGVGAGQQKSGNALLSPDQHKTYVGRRRSLPSETDGL
ncbi:hypothetical protein [Bacillus sp. UNCCL13]|nr:hypothetical protein [Bacillus sp. UNCCL13]